MITINSNGIQLTIGPFEGQYVTISLSGAAFKGTLQTYLYTDGPYLVQFLKETFGASELRTGKQIWRSIEDDVRIEAQMQKTGKIQITVSLQKSISSETHWKVSATFDVHPSEVVFS